jgi:hypothetical protein
VEHRDGTRALRPWFREYPKKLGEETTRSLEEARLTFAEAAQKEAAHVERMLSEKVAEMRVEIARRLGGEAGGGSTASRRHSARGSLSGRSR